MIPGHGGRLRQSPEQRGGCIERGVRLLAVHELLCVGDGRAEYLADGMMPEADSQNRYLPHQGPDDLLAYPGVGGTAGAGGEDDPVRGKGFDLRNGHGIVSDDRDLRVNGADELLEVIRKAVTVSFRGAP